MIVTQEEVTQMLSIMQDIVKQFNIGPGTNRVERWFRGCPKFENLRSPKERFDSTSISLIGESHNLTVFLLHELLAHGALQEIEHVISGPLTKQIFGVYHDTPGRIFCTRNLSCSNPHISIAHEPQ